MKSAVFLIITSSSLANALRCGGLFSSPCIAQSDIRFDSGFSNSLKDQSGVWKRQEGYYTYEQYYYDGDLNPIYFRSLKDGSTVVKSFPTIGFANFTIVGSRVYRHRYDIYPGSEPGAPSFATVADAWETSTYEKDGSTLSLGSLLGFANDATVIEDVGTATTQVLDSRTLVKKGFTKGGIVRQESLHLTETYQCLDDNCNQMSVAIEEFESTADGSQKRKAESFINMKKVTAERWKAELEHALDSYNVSPEHKVEIPMKGQCMSGECNMSEEWWCQYDPECSESPYTEPPANLELDIVDVLLVTSFIVWFALIYTMWLQNQASSYRPRLARCFSTQTGKPFEELTSQVLQRNFKQALMEPDNEHVSLEDLKTFLSPGNSGEISHASWAALHRSIDPHHQGIDFNKFYALVSSLKSQYENLTTQETEELRKLEIA